MHAQELVLKHALGLAVRRKNRIIHDQFIEGKAIRDAVRNLLSTVMDKKAKARYKEYSQMALTGFFPVTLCSGRDSNPRQ